MFADHNSKFNKNCRKVSNTVENIVRKREIARDEQFLLFLQCFKKKCTERQIKPRVCLEKGKHVKDCTVEKFETSKTNIDTAKNYQFLKPQQLKAPDLI